VGGPTGGVLDHRDHAPVPRHVRLAPQEVHRQGQPGPRVREVEDENRQLAQGRQGEVHQPESVDGVVEVEEVMRQLVHEARRGRDNRSSGAKSAQALPGQTRAGLL
jgi:hypothetical protein